MRLETHEIKQGRGANQFFYHGRNSARSRNGELTFSEHAVLAPSRSHLHPAVVVAAAALVILIPHRGGGGGGGAGGSYPLAPILSLLVFSPSR